MHFNSPSSHISIENSVGMLYETSLLTQVYTEFYKWLICRPIFS
jgi:hypothetical protein